MTTEAGKDGAPGKGWLPESEYLPSPNCDERPDDARVDLVIIHAISLPPGEFGGPCVRHFFTNVLDHSTHPYFAEIESLRVSAHFLIERDGTLVQLVDVHRRAWHAGESQWCGRDRCNDYSVGVELEGCDEQPFEDAQYETLHRLLRWLAGVFPAITPERVVGHSDVAPGRKTDPGPCFDWARARAALPA